ncbi:hypothetical protein AVEN_224406-1 [Araneus ventricosus]|uniref:Uncharacterized protein n=1 Tax=Araneus ventricosus TaxID=182803 RepID=A0A4Y2AGN7_ARAVE|nr:hypothetical protein AVEN_224406-1 [Araneus ventricosus]
MKEMLVQKQTQKAEGERLKQQIGSSGCKRVVLTYERDVGSETNAEGGRRTFKATNIASSGCKRVVLTYERDVGSETNAEGGRRTFKATDRKLGVQKSSSYL